MGTQAVTRTYTGELRFQERGSNKRRYLQQKVRETDYSLGTVVVVDGGVRVPYPQIREFFEDIPLVDEDEKPIDAAMASDKMRVQR